MSRPANKAARETIDLIIAAFCVERRYAPPRDDRDFDPLAAHMGLSDM